MPSPYNERDMAIRMKYAQGAHLENLGNEYAISEDGVKKIIYKKGAMMMSSKAIDFSKYFWQDDLIRVRRSKPDDWKHHNSPGYNSDERFFSDYRQELPNDDDLWKENWESYVTGNMHNSDRILVAFETLDGKYVGSGNIHGINERNGTFGLFVGAEEARYALAGARLMLNYAFNELRLNNCHTGFIENDSIYQPLFVKLGFKLEGTRRQQIFHKGQY